MLFLDIPHRVSAYPGPLTENVMSLTHAYIPSRHLIEDTELSSAKILDGLLNKMVVENKQASKGRIINCWRKHFQNILLWNSARIQATCLFDSRPNTIHSFSCDLQQLPKKGKGCGWVFCYTAFQQFGSTANEWPRYHLKQLAQGSSISRQTNKPPMKNIHTKRKCFLSDIICSEKDTTSGFHFLNVSFIA